MLINWTIRTQIQPLPPDGTAYLVISLSAVTLVATAYSYE